jgi:membrane protease subunit (stomatin/prohibitin family)
MVAAEISATLAEYGVSIPELYIENISLPPAVEAVLDKRTSVGLAGDLGKYTQFSAAEAMTAAANNPAGGGMAAGIGAGMGASMGMAMAGQAAGPWGARPSAMQPAQQPMAPPLPPVEQVWHTAENGVTSGPFSRATMGRMAQDGRLTRQTMVWTAGQDGWKTAAEVTALATLFTILPPPPPPGV